MSSAAETLAIVAAFVAMVGTLARVSMRTRVHAAGLPLLLVGWAGLLLAIAPERIRAHAALAVVGVVVAAATCWFAARLVTGRERWLLALAGAVLTLRVPVPTGGDTSMLLVPLYAVVALGATALARTELARARAASGLDGLRRRGDRGGATRMIDVGAALIPALACASIAWSFDPRASAVALGCFLVPFQLTYAMVREWAAARVDLRPATWALVGSGVIAALVGCYQALVREVWWNPKVIDANRFRADFRTNSIYWDPNIYGRALVVAIVALVAWLLVARITRVRVSLALVALAFLTVALWNTYSQSSWVALAAALIVVAVLTLPPHPRRWVAVALVGVALIGLPAAARGLAGSDASGRAEVIRAGGALAGEKPVAGWGVGAFSTAALARARERGDTTPGLTASHTTPATVLAELGVLGFASYVILLTSAAVAMLARWRQTSTPASAARAEGTVEGRAPTGWPIPPIIWASGAIAALVAHSLLYAGFFEDATLWVALALLASLPQPTDNPLGEPVVEDADAVA